ncbi:hypothetical protein [Spiroplasma endosymbiont of Agriotes lineatus]|uniref:hypothetical protein n=1 Tax=Spiroplasma endosymbiont of Agriotes lineatus TaxID=3077930 RepID=UPI0030D1C37E
MTKISNITNIITTFSYNDDTIYLITNSKIYIIKNKEIITSIEIDKIIENISYNIFRDDYCNLYFFSSKSLSLIKIKLSLNKDIKKNKIKRNYR